MTIRKKGDKTRYSFVDAGCLGRKCFAPGMYQHRSPLSCGGSRNTGSPDTPCCLNRAYHGCPEGPVGERFEECLTCNDDGVIESTPAGFGHDDDLAEYVPCHMCGGAKQVHYVGLPEVNADLKRQRLQEGWKVA